MAGGLPRTNAAMRLVVKSWVTATCDCIALNFATRLLKYGTTSGLVSSNTMLVVAPPDEEHPATRPGPATAAAPSPTAFSIDRRVRTGPAPRPGRRSLSCCTRDLLRSLGPPPGSQRASFVARDGARTSVLRVRPPKRLETFP